MLSESDLRTLIDGGENATVDFKRELDLNTSRGKSELIKDIISIANSVHRKGYILLGIDDDKNIIGIDALEEERIQQIAQTYISPPVSIICTLFPILSGAPISIGVLEIEPMIKPHKVIRSIDRLEQNEVFVRHGSIVSKASPEEIIKIHTESRLTLESRNYLKSAEANLKLGNLQKSVDAYSRAIELLPTDELFLARGKVYVLLGEKIRPQLSRELSEMIADFLDKKQEGLPDEMRAKIDQLHKERELAIKDFSDAILLTESITLEKQARLARLTELADSGHDYDPEARKQDLSWLKQHATGQEYGKVLYLEVKWIGSELYLFEDQAAKVAAMLDEAIDRGYSSPDLYFLRAQAHCGNYNYGLALGDINTAINMVKGIEELAEYLDLQAYIFANMNLYDEVYVTYSKIKQLLKGEKRSYMGIVYNIEAMLSRYALDYKFGRLEEHEVIAAKRVAKIFSSWHEKVKEKHPKIAGILQELVEPDNNATS